MADDGVFLANRPLLLDLDGQVARHLDEWLTREGMVECQPRSLVDTRDQPYGDRYHAFPLPTPNYPPAASIGINQLYWPTGAMRHARGYFICSETDAAYFRTLAYSSPVNTSAGAVVRKHVPLTFLARLGGKTFTTSLYVLSPRPLTSVVGSRLWLLPVVDVRYWWAQSGIGSHPQRNPLLLEEEFAFKAWSDVWTAIASEIGAFTVAQTSNRFKPDPWELSRQFENVAHMLDVCAHSCGLRVVRSFAGAVRLMSASESLAARLVNWQLPHAIVAGDTWEQYPMAERLQIMFQQLTEGAVDKILQWWRVDLAAKPYSTDANITLIDAGDNQWGDATDPEASFGVPNCNEVLWTTFHANFDHTRPDAPTNQSDITAFAREVYKRHLEYQLAQGMDVTFAGLHSWSLTGLEDYALLDFGAEGHESTTLYAPPQPPGSQNPPGPPKLVTERSRRLTTRVRSMPQEFGIRHVLCQTDQFLRVQQHESYFKIIEFTPEGAGTSVKFLPPGGSAYARAVWLDGTTWTEHGSPLTLTVQLFDPNYLACGLKDEVLHAIWSDERHRWEVDREHGLEREAKADADISAGGSGGATIYVQETVTSPAIHITVYNTWIHDGLQVSAGKELTAVFYRDQKRWLRDNAQCEQ